MAVAVSLTELDINDEGLEFLKPRWISVDRRPALGLTVLAGDAEAAARYAAERVGLTVGRDVTVLGCEPRI